jgi:mitogen-activated protein kinase 1/3
LAKFTKKVSGGITCGGSLALQHSEDEDAFTTNPAVVMKSSSSKENNMERPIPERPPRKQKKISSSSNDDYDHHTLATATTASATISYSTDQGDAASIASEVGMEVVMSLRSRDSNDMNLSQQPQQQNNTTTLYQPHSFPAGKHTFTVDRRYSMIRLIGSGAYGVVISANDAKSKENAAIKMVPKAFADEIDAKRILREIKLLKHFQHDNIVGLTDMMPPNVARLEDFNDVYMVTDLMETDLHRIIYSKQKLSIDHVQYFVYQVLRGLKYIHSCKVLHRDLKPSNLLVNSNCDLKICDFGLARGVDASQKDDRTETMLLTEYVVTRWYRAPEIMLACHEYSYPIDVWSVGCIFAELILRKPLFPGDDYIDQVSHHYVFVCESVIQDGLC